MIKPYHETAHGVLYHADCLTVMAEMAEKSVDLVLTSPPYDNLREYGEGKGYAFTFSEFKCIADIIERLLVERGICVWIVSDAVICGSETGSSFRQALYFKDIGMNLNDTMIWVKPSFTFPESVRYPQVFEYMFILSKGRVRCFNPIKDRKNKYGTCFGKNTSRNAAGKRIELKKNKTQDYGIRYNVWDVNTVGQYGSKVANDHPAAFPANLAGDHIASWSHPQDLILDPFAGSGTTAIACIKTNRRYILIEKEEKYCEIAARRIDSELDQTDIFRGEA